MNDSNAILLMKEYYGENSKWIEHSLSVTNFADEILRGEGVASSFTQAVVSLAAIFHDVGIPKAIEKYGTAKGPYQEQEGESIARDLLKRLSIRPDILERVCYIVGHHHTQEAIDGLDFQIIWEADALVNIPNRFSKGVDINFAKAAEQNFKTAAGFKLFQNWGETQGLN